MKKCLLCKKKGFQAEKFIGLKQPKDRVICFSCAIEIYIAVRTIRTTGKAITGKLNPLEVE